MKKLVLISFFSAALAACNNDGATTSSGPTVDSTTNKVYSTSVTLDTAVDPAATDTGSAQSPVDSLP